MSVLSAALKENAAVKPIAKSQKQMDFGSANFDRDYLLHFVLGGIAKIVEETAGAEDAATYMGSVMHELGADLEKRYTKARHVRHLSRAQLSAILIDAMNRAGGAFHVIDEDEGHIILGNNACPLGTAVDGHPSLCMLTSNILGALSANAAGYAAIDIEETIARGAAACRIVIHLKKTELKLDTMEYFRDGNIDRS